MPVACEICADAGVRIAVDKLLRDKRSVRDIAGMVGRSKSCVGRHRKHAELPEDAKQPRSTRSRGTGQLTSQTGRCTTCGQSVDAIEPPALLKRSERFLWMAESIAADALADKDGRLLLQAIDRGNKALETLMRAHGMLSSGSDGVTVNVAVDARKLEADVAAWSRPARLIAAAELTEDEALEAIQYIVQRRAAVVTIDHEALPAG